MMNELIQLSEREIGGAIIQTVNARDLHSFLESRQDFSTWIKSRIEQYEFTEHQDYVSSLHKKMERENHVVKFVPGENRIEYHLSLDMAKEISMVERNEKGKQARKYFIECEKRSKAIVDPMKALSDPTIMRGLLLTYTEKVLVLESKVVELAPKAKALDRIATNSEGSFCIRDAAKTLQVREKVLKQTLIERSWLYRRPMGSGYLAYSDKLKRGLMEHKIVRGERSDGSEWVETQARITAKGMAYLSEIFSCELAFN